jgi:hypothetical protein
MMLLVIMMVMLLVLLLVVIIIFLVVRFYFAFSVCRSMGRARAPSTAARSKSPCWPLPLRVTPRSFAQPVSPRCENANQRRTT